VPRSEAESLSAGAVAQASVSYDAVTVAAGHVWWLESRPERDGRAVLVRWDDLGGTREVSPPAGHIGTDIHAYGGGAYAVAPDGVWCVDPTQGLTYTPGHDGREPPVASQVPNGSSLGDLQVAAGRLLCVRETPAGDQLLEVTAGVAEPRVLVRTDGFFAAPRAASGRLAWLRWRADRMPWDDSELWVAPYVGGGGLGRAERVAGGNGESVTQPMWGPEGELLFVSDRSGWWNLYRWDGTSVRPVAPMAADVTPAPWELGYASYVPMAGGRAVMTAHEGARHRLLVADRHGQVRPVDVPYTSFKPYLAGSDRYLFAVAASATVPSQVVAIDLARPEDSRVLARPPQVVAPTALSEPVVLRLASADGATVAVVLYPPGGASVDWCAPLVVRAHPGPTASALIRLDWHVQFLTSNGFAVADVDYRGSTGYGREFRQGLYGRWGIDDVADCVLAANHLLDAGRSRPGEVFISGASAGGYTALKAVSADGPFAGAAARSSIVDPARWYTNAPRWQRPHAAQLASTAGPVRPAAVRRPVLLIHGVDDHVARVDDVLDLANGLRDADKPHRLVLLGGSGHRLSAQEATERVLQAEIDFYRSILHGGPVAWSSAV